MSRCPTRPTVAAAVSTAALAVFLSATPALASTPSEGESVVWDHARVLDDDGLLDRLREASAETGVSIAVLTVNGDSFPDEEDPDRYSYLYDDCVPSDIGGPYGSENSPFDTGSLGNDDPYGLLESDCDPESFGPTSRTDEEIGREYDSDVREYLMRQGDTEITLANGVLRDDVVLITITPDDRRLGLYAGDDVTDVDEDMVESVTEDMVDPARDAASGLGTWDDVADAGLASYTDRATGGPEKRVSYGVGIVALLVAGGGLGWYLTSTHRPSAEHTAEQVAAWEDLRDEALRRRAFSVHQDADAALSLLRGALGPDGRVPRGAIGRDRDGIRRVLDADWLDSVRRRLGYYERGAGWQSTWAGVKADLAGTTLEEAEESVDRLTAVDAPEDTVEAAREIVSRHRAAFAQIESAVLDESLSVEDGELRLSDLREELDEDVRRFRSEHDVEQRVPRGQAPDQRAGSLMSNHWYWIWYSQTYRPSAGSGSGSATSSTTFTSTRSSGGGFSGGSRGF